MSEPEVSPDPLWNRPITRRAALGLGAAVAVVGTFEVIEKISSSDHAVTPQTSARAFQPVVRWGLRSSTEGWRPSVISPGTTVSHDRAGWLLAAGSGTVEVESARDALPKAMNWTRTDRDTADRLTVSVQVDGAAPTYAVQIVMCWQGTDSHLIGSAESAAFTVPTGIPVDLDTWWDCRGTAPHDVLTRVQGIKVRASAHDNPVELRVRDVRQPPSTLPNGPAPVGLAAAFHAAPPASLPAPQPADAYQRAVLAKLQNAANWGSRNHRAIHIGEWAWPKEVAGEAPNASASQTMYGEMAEQWMRLADSLAIPFTPWGESAYWSGSVFKGKSNYGSYPDASYFCGEGYTSNAVLPRVISAMKPSAKILENHLGRVPTVPPSISLVGMCLTHLKDGTQYSSTNIGKRNSDYFTENPDSLKYLHSRGYRMFRLPFRWDRVMRNPDDSALDPDEWGYVQAGIDAILELPGTSVIVDQHSSAQFWISPDPADKSVPAVKHTVDGPTKRVTTESYVHLWTLLSDQLRSDSDRVVYEITNEPHDSSPLIVKRYTQAVVSALRARGDSTFCLIPSYPFDSVTQAFTEQNQPFPWIEDPAGSRQHAYTLHQYMDYDQSGSYQLSYAATLQKYS